MTSAQVILTASGTACVIASIVFTVKKIGQRGRNQIKLFGQSFDLTGSAVVFLVIGAALLYAGASARPEGPSAQMPSQPNQVTPQPPSIQATGHIKGVVKDQSGVGLPEVNVIAINTQSQIETPTMTDGGAYSVASLPLGTYTVVAKRVGFKTARREVELRDANLDVTTNFTLEEHQNEEVADFLAAVGSGKLQLVRDYIDNGMPPDRQAIDNPGNTALAIAASIGNDNVVKLLLESGADPNKRMKNGSVPLIEAAYVGHSKVVRLLLDHKADPNVKKQDGSGDTALMFACIQGHDEVVRILTDTAALSPNDTNDAGQTALGFAKALPASPARDRIIAALMSIGAH